MNLERLKADLRKHEGLRLKAYKDTVGVMTIGYGRNLEDVGISKGEAEYMLSNDISDAIEAAQGLVESWFELTSRRQEVLVNMAFNLGATRLRGFKKMLAAIAADDHEEVAVQMLDSKWARQIGIRALDLSEAWKHG